MADTPSEPEVSAPPEAVPVAVEKPNGKPTIAVKVYAPFKIYFEGEAYSLSAVNATGPFDILPRHHKFLCMLVPCDVKIQTPDGEKVVKIHRALMHVTAESVAVFVDV